jgi:hypothetical protein
MEDFMAWSRALLGAIALSYALAASAADSRELLKPPTSAPATTRPAIVDTLDIDHGKYKATIDTTETPELTDWARKDLAPVVKDWYPKIVAMLPSEGYHAPAQFSITFKREMKGVAFTAGTRVVGAYDWYIKNMKGEGVGSIVHELVHVVQQYGMARRTNPQAKPNPGWLVEGIPDYIRWYLYEPQSHGADIGRRGAESARYDKSYRVTANFLHWVIANYDPDIVRKLNAAMREGKYGEELWEKWTGESVQDLGEWWKQSLEKSAAAR